MSLSPPHILTLPPHPSITLWHNLKIELPSLKDASSLYISLQEHSCIPWNAIPDIISLKPGAV